MSKKKNELNYPTRAPKSYRPRLIMASTMIKALSEAIQRNDGKDIPVFLYNSDNQYVFYPNVVSMGNLIENEESRKYDLINMYDTLNEKSNGKLVLISDIEPKSLESIHEGISLNTIKLHPDDTNYLIQLAAKRSAAAKKAAATRKANREKKNSNKKEK